MTDQHATHEAIEALRAQLAQLSDRLTQIEQAVAVRPGGSSVAPAEADNVAEDLASVIAAAVAAYLGVRPHIRQIRLVGDASWAQQGRVTIQASHALPLHQS